MPVFAKNAGVPTAPTKSGRARAGVNTAEVVIGLGVLGLLVLLVLRGC